MGRIVSKFRKAQSTVEILEELDRDISHLEKFRRANQELRQKVIGKLLLYSVVLYIACAFALYFFFMPQDWTYRIYGLMPFILFPFLVYLLKRFLHWFFVRKISQNEVKLQGLREKRKDILENVMETETYKKAKEILERFDPETKKKLEEEKIWKDANSPGSPNQPPGLRKRPVDRNQMQGVASTQNTPLSPVGRGRGMMQTPVNGSVRGPSHRPTPQVPILPRPILPLNKTRLDKLVEYMIGDGTSHRYALICQHCYNHNGMALKEEFEYLAFRCAYCRFFNPARKQRPNAPRLEMSPPPAMPSSESNSAEGSADEDSTAPSLANSEGNSRDHDTAEAANLTELKPEEILNDSGIDKVTLQYDEAGERGATVQADSTTELTESIG